MKRKRTISFSVLALIALLAPPVIAGGSHSPRQVTRSVRLVDTTIPRGQEGDVRVELESQGNEAAIGFSVNFDPRVLTYRRTVLGSDATGATLMTNTLQAGEGRVGITLSFPIGAGQTFQAGKRHVVSITFSAAPGATTELAAVGFGNVPVLSEVTDTSANRLEATWLDGVITISAPAQVGRVVRLVDTTITRGQEGEVRVELESQGNEAAIGFSVNFDPRLLAFKGAVLGADAAGATLMTNSLQAADGRVGISLSFPIGVGQTFQAGTRHVVSITFAAAPGATTELASVSFGNVPVISEVTDTTANPLEATWLDGVITISAPAQVGRVVRLVDTTIRRGHEGEVRVELESQGNEAAIGFSVNFDPRVLTYRGIVLGSDATGATLMTNTLQASEGRIGMTLSFPIGVGQTFQAGTRHVVSITFAAPIAGGSALTLVSFGDVPVISQVTDASANPLEVTWANGIITVTTDIVPPTVVSSSADNSASSVKVTFSENVNAGDATAKANFALESPKGTAIDLSSSGIKLTYDAATYTTTIQGVTLKAGDTYKVRVTNVRDIAGNVIVDNGTTNVSEGTVADVVPPTVKSGEAGNDYVSVTFSEEVKQTDAETIGNYTLESPTGTVIDLTGKTATFDASTKTAKISGVKLETGATWKIRVRNVNDLAGNAIVDNGTTNVASGTVKDTTPPTVIASKADNATSSVEVTFSENVNAGDATAKANFALESPKGTAIDLSSSGIKLTYDAATYTTTIQGVTLKAGDTYKVRVTNVRDIAGNVIVDNGTTNVSEGTVADVVPPTVVACGAAQTGSGYATVTFSEAVQSATATNRNNYEVTQDSAALDLSTAVFEYDPATKTVKISGQGFNVRAGKEVVVQVRNVKDLAGNVIVDDGVGNKCSTICRDEEPPRVVGSRADNKSASVQILFSEDVNSSDATTKDNFVLESPIGTKVSLAGVQLAYDSATHTTSMTGVTLKAGDTYKVIVTGVRDIVGNVIVADGVANVSTGTVSDVVGPRLESCQADNTSVRITFAVDESGLKESTLTNLTNYTIYSPADASTPIDLSGARAVFDSPSRTVRIAPLALHNGDSFRVRVVNIEDNAGNAITDDGSGNVCSGSVQLTTGATLRLVSGNEQSGAAGEKLANPLVVEVVVPDGVVAMEQPGVARAVVAVPGVEVAFKIAEGDGAFVAGGGNVTTLWTRTDRDGKASAEWILGPKVGVNKAICTAPAIEGGAVTFTATAVAGAPAQIALGASPSETTLGGQSRITATVTDQHGNRVPATPLKFEVIAGQGALSNAGSRVSTATITTGDYGVAEVDLMNISYGSNKVKVSDARDPAPQNPAPSEIIEVVGKFKIPLSRGLNLVGIPFTFTNADPAAVFGLPANTLRLAGWNEAANNDLGDYIFYNGSNYSIQPGKGFWIRKSDDADLGIASGTPVDTTKEFVIPIGNGYQLIANPFPVEIPWDLTKIRIRQNGVDKGDLKTNGVPSGAFQQTSVDPYAWVWNTATQAYNLVFDPLFIAQVPDALRATMRTTIPVGAGAWYRSKRPGVELVFPAPGVVRSSEAEVRQIASRKPDERHWAVELIAEAVTGVRDEKTASLRSAANLFGVLETELLPNCGLQVAKPPVPMTEDGSFVDLAFLAVNSVRGSSDEQLAWDLRPVQMGVEALGTAVWRFVVATNLRDSAIRISYPNLSMVPKKYRLYLIDETSNHKQAMRTTTSYTFPTGTTPQTSRHFRIEVTKLPTSRLQIGNLSASSDNLRNGGAGIRISFSLSQAAQARLRIRAASGRTVYEFPAAELKAGVNAARWDGKNQWGAYVPRGIYLIELTARNDLGEEVKAVRTVRVQ